MTVAVLDTNVLVSGVTGFLIDTSVPGQILHLWQAGRFTLAVSDHILAELERTLQKPYFQRRLSTEYLAAVRVLFRTSARLTPLTVQVHDVASHPEDDLVLATALSGQADYLITGDRHLLALGNYQEVAILSPRAFLQQLQQEGSSREE